jgi:hypothetical protein
MHLCGLVDAYGVEGGMHQVEEARGEGREEVKTFAHEMATHTQRGEGSGGLPEQQLLVHHLLCAPAGRIR